jgi:hypothetical protein
LSRVYPRRRELEHALAAGKRAVQINPSNALAQSNYSLALKEAQRRSDATAAAQAAADISSQVPRFPFNLSILDLLQGNYARGWTGFESRWNGSAELKGAHPPFPVPRWNGEPVRGKTLLLWGEQGFGDAIQFSRFVAMLASRSRRRAARSCGPHSGRCSHFGSAWRPKQSNALRTTARCPSSTITTRC